MKKKYLLSLFLITNLLTFKLQAIGVDSLLPPQTLADFADTAKTKVLWESTLKPIFEKHKLQGSATFEHCAKQGKLGKTYSSTIDTILTRLQKIVPEINVKHLKWDSTWKSSINQINFPQYRAHLLYESARLIVEKFPKQPPVPNPAARPEITKNFQISLGNLVLIDYPYSWYVLGVFSILICLLIVILISGSRNKYKALEKRINALETKPAGNTLTFDDFKTQYGEELKEYIASLLKVEENPNGSREDPATGENDDDKKPKSVVPIQGEDRTIYAKQSVNNSFMEKDLSYKPNPDPKTVFFVITVSDKKPNEGILDLVPDEVTRQAMTANRDTYFKHCRQMGAGKKIISTTAGKVVKNGTKWDIKEPVIVVFGN